MEQNNPHQNQTFMSIRELTISGLLAGITIFLGLTGYGFIPLVVMNATILHIPTIIGTQGRRSAFWSVSFSGSFLSFRRCVRRA